MTEFEWTRRGLGQDLGEGLVSAVRGDQADGQAEFDWATLWECYENHRTFLTQTLLDIASPLRQLLVLGSGPCLDLDLQKLRQCYAGITLVDQHDSRAGVLSQGLSLDLIRVISGVDVTGVHTKLENFRAAESPVSMQEILQTLKEERCESLGQYDVVASTCLLSQLMNHAYQMVGSDSPYLVDLLVQIRQQHLDLMVQRMRPGGYGCLFSDFVSSVALPEMMVTGPSEWKELFRKAVAQQNFFHGLNPERVLNAFYQPPMVGQIEALRGSDPWRWLATPRLGYGCFCFVFRRRQESVQE